MSSSAQKKAIREHRARQVAKGISRFEVQARDEDRALIRAFARQLADDGPAGQSTRAAVEQLLSGEPPRRGGIVEALRRSPLVGADMLIEREVVDGRRIDL